MDVQLYIYITHAYRVANMYTNTKADTCATVYHHSHLNTIYTARGTGSRTTSARL